MRKNIKFGLYPEQNRLSLKDQQDLKQKKPYNCRNFGEVMYPGNGKSSLLFEAQEENWSNISVEWCHPLYNYCFWCGFFFSFFYFKAGHGGIFSYCSFFSMPLNETPDRSEGRRSWFPSIMCTPCHPERKKKVYFKNPF